MDQVLMPLLEPICIVICVFGFVFFPCFLGGFLLELFFDVQDPWPRFFKWLSKKY